MRAVVDDAGRRSLLLREDGDQALVRDLTTGEQRTRPLASLGPAAEDPFVALAGPDADSLPAPLERAPTDQARGLLVELHLAGPRPVRTLLSETTLCESDLHGLVGDLRAAGLVRETTVDGERGYGLTDEAADALAALAH